MYIPVNADYSVFQGFRINQNLVDFILCSPREHYLGDTIDGKNRRNTREIYLNRVNNCRNFLEKQGAVRVSSNALDCTILRLTDISKLAAVANFIITETDQHEPFCTAMYYRNLLGSLMQGVSAQPLTFAFDNSKEKVVQDVATAVEPTIEKVGKKAGIRQ